MEGIRESLGLINMQMFMADSSYFMAETHTTQSVPHVRFWGCRQAKEGSASSYTRQVLVTPTTVCLHL